MELMIEAGVPAGVINFVPSSGPDISEVCLSNPDFGGVHFTGSTAVFQGLWQRIGQALPNLRSYPRIVGETGGKDFVVAHPDCDEQGLLVALLRGSFEYQGQKCSAASRCYIPESLWDDVKNKYLPQVNNIAMGDVNDFNNFMNAVIDEASFDNISNYIDYAKNSSEAEIISGGGYDKTKGYFIEPTTILTTNANFKTMEEEIFGPVLTIYLYNDSWNNICEIVDRTSPYALTGAIFAEDKKAVASGRKMLTQAAGNFYINDKPTGAVVGQQPFGGSRASGTNDKAGSPLNLYRWISLRTIKETFDPPTDYRYAFMGDN